MTITAATEKERHDTLTLTEEYRMTAKSIKVENIMATVTAHHRVIVRLDKSSGINQLTITEGKGGYTVGIHPGGKLRKFSEAGLKEMLNEYSFYIQNWKAA
ncbi:hypothetical protein [Escherichia phage EC167]|jgi:hypothetical protein|nr:hypothetical protein [Escherichia phage EC167]